MVDPLSTIETKRRRIERILEPIFAARREYRFDDAIALAEAALIELPYDYVRSLPEQIRKDKAFDISRTPKRLIEVAHA